MFKIKSWTLGHKKAVAKHEEIVNHNYSYSLTITLNPYYNSYSMDDQYNSMKRDIIGLLKEIGAFYEQAMITPEYTKDYNLHWHCYIVITKDIMVFEQNMKHHKRKFKMIGFNYKLKKIDSVTNELKGYPFKDIQRTNSYSEALFNRFNPTHIFIQPIGNILVNTNNDKEVIDNNKTYKVRCIQTQITKLKKQIDIMEKII